MKNAFHSPLFALKVLLKVLPTMRANNAELASDEWL